MTSINHLQAMAQRIHRRLREKITGVADPYRCIRRDWQIAFAMELIPMFRGGLKAASDPLFMANSSAIAGNVIDMGSNSILTEQMCGKL